MLQTGEKIQKRRCLQTHDTQLQQEDTVINLSNKQQTDAHISVLSKGFSFVPATVDRQFDARVDLFKFFCRIKLKQIYTNKSTVQDTPFVEGESKTPFKPKSTFCPVANNSSINTYCRLVDSYSPIHVFKRPYQCDYMSLSSVSIGYINPAHFPPNSFIYEISHLLCTFC